MNGYAHPSKKHPYKRRYLKENLSDMLDMLTYNKYDVIAQKEIADKLPMLPDFEYQVWLSTQKMNNRGVAVDIDAIKTCKNAINTVTTYYEKELYNLTGGCVRTAGENKKLTKWLNTNGVGTKSVDAKNVKELIERYDGTSTVGQVLRIKKILSSASIKKVVSILNRVSSDGRVRDHMVYCGADRTGRFGSKGVQIHNLRNVKLGEEQFDKNIEILRTNPFEFDNPFDVMGGMVRGFFTADKGKDFICSDYRAIEAVALACLAGEQWRIDVFKTHGRIYELSASKITGVPFQEFLDYQKQHGEKHPLRNTIGKVAELASGYQGWIGAWKQFGADKHFNNDEEIKQSILKWRSDSPNIVNFWHGVEGAAKRAIQIGHNTPCNYRNIVYRYDGDNLYCKLPSGRELTYWKAGLRQGVTPYGKAIEQICFYGWNSNQSSGLPMGWTQFDTYGGKLTENIVQAVCRDILCHAVFNLEKAGYTPVFHVHDEIICEVPRGWGSIKEMELIMSALPDWASDWPIIAHGGWRGLRYRKD